MYEKSHFHVFASGEIVMVVFWGSRLNCTSEIHFKASKSIQCWGTNYMFRVKVYLGAYIFQRGFPFRKPRTGKEGWSSNQQLLVGGVWVHATEHEEEEEDFNEEAEEDEEEEDDDAYAYNEEYN